MASVDADIDGVLPVDKPVGPTSHDVVGMARRGLRTRRIGHTGTLDPFASGLLLLCIGSATRIAEYLSGLDKRYVASVRLGVATDTDDLTGEVLRAADARDVTLASVDAALAPLLGEVLQTPPAFSAKKRAGERAYAAARQGRTVQLDAVRVRIDELKVIRFAPPDLDLEVACGSGTYIRAIARDLGEALGLGGHLTSLRRTAVGAFTVEDAIPAAELGDPDRVQAALMPPAAALAHLPHLTLDEWQLVDVRHGRAVTTDSAPDADALVLVNDAGDLVAIGRRTGGVIRPRKVFL